MRHSLTPVTTGLSDCHVCGRSAAWLFVDPVEASSYYLCQTHAADSLMASLYLRRKITVSDPE